MRAFSNFFGRKLWLFSLLSLFALAGCFQEKPWNETTLDGALAPLDFQMTRVTDGAQVTGKDYLGKVVVLAFGYTNCPDICPTTLANLATVVEDLGPAAKDLQVLFVTVDPNRDTVAQLKSYMGNFGPHMDGLRGSEPALAALAKRYKLHYSVTPAKGDQAYDVSHGAAVYVFDQTGKSRLLVSSMFTVSPDFKGLEADLRRLLNEGGSGSWWGRLKQYF